MGAEGLGEFLRARRSRRRPEDAAVVFSGQRRVPGLRREEVAVLAGVNVDYYTRLEQGRERHPSGQVLDALSRALDLDEDARDHLYRLAGGAPPTEVRPAVEVVSPTLRALLDGYPGTPALVLGRRLDVLARNALADALYSPFGVVDNLARVVFLDPAAPRFYPRWRWVAQATVASLREGAGHEPGSVALADLVRELSAGSDVFRELWAGHSVRGKTRDAKDFQHPEVGALTLSYESFDVRGAPGQQLVIYHAEPGSPSARALALLGTLSATSRVGDG
ncbi:XRE family transcriptional regulator [Actinoalloteichus sp. AHMU CJ021]|uniref:Helix-turn-helix domain-containing protein n=1 Tax=Actinoalloteichus caeruleus DSM 43889 TaxID=1120930 RepID=A0ABT1JCA4_ACTCY|nr:helix-turn-helix transcriptional regulator [Actinoalloteichus caeruleus]AUS80732.1 XRE family transcriptional regulator [Actinoalloteichus sp. AHMU CJ021]MCP2330126.1 Helix-turn-helix domain-containing protein [Actinoalloteichus caeruleus DSM 43889]